MTWRLSISQPRMQVVLLLEQRCAPRHDGTGIESSASASVSEDGGRFGYLVHLSHGSYHYHDYSPGMGNGYHPEGGLHLLPRRRGMRVRSHLGTLGGGGIIAMWAPYQMCGWQQLGGMEPNSNLLMGW